MMPRLPVNIPRCGVAMMSPVGVTRFCSGIRLTIHHKPHCEERSDEAIQLSAQLPALDCFAALAMTAGSRRAVADRRLEKKCGVPWKENPGVLRHLGDEC